MGKRNIFFVVHINECIHRILDYTNEMNEKSFLKNKLVQDAVIRNLEIIGEATKNLTEDFRSKYQYIPWKKIAGMRDKLIHNYMGVDLPAVWSVVEDIIPIFKDQIEYIISVESKESNNTSED